MDSELERELLRAYIDSANDGIFVICDEMKFHVANPLLEQWLGLGEAELTAHGRRIPITELFGSAETEALFCSQFIKVLQGKPASFEAALNPPKGTPRWVEFSLSRVQLEVGDLVIGILRDVTERRRLHTTLQHNASHDDLTGLLNRREFQMRLNALVDTAHTRGGQHALIYVDLDQLGVCLNALVKDQGVLARLGGDEFGLLLNDIPIEQAMAVAEALCDAVAAYRFTWQEQHFDITASIGVRAITAETVSAEDVLSAADAACYVAKDQGRNRAQLYFGGKACAGKRQEMQWVGKIQKALEENRLQIWQQSILNLSAQGATQFEVLLRLVDEQGGIVAPGQFFPAAERYGLMPAIDRWVINHLLLDAQHAGLRAALDNQTVTRCAINLSGASLNDDRFVEYLEAILKRNPLLCSALCFEITETVAVANFGRAREVINTVKQFGCQFALDDFGSGMSSFGYLKNLPVDYLKIDGSLVRQIDSNPTDLAMLDAINRIGQVLGLQTVAEFVESERSLQLLRDIGVNYAQGYAIHRPELLAWR
ncbi:MAG: EAL domain-containing protein [Gammaproteobacteria bacterium]|nr:EAL domain-containing protein [Gammaproteobacteria bacterium]